MLMFTIILRCSLTLFSVRIWFSGSLAVAAGERTTMLLLCLLLKSFSFVVSNTMLSEIFIITSAVIIIMITKQRDR